MKKELLVGAHPGVCHIRSHEDTMIIIATGRWPLTSFTQEFNSKETCDYAARMFAQDLNKKKNNVQIVTYGCVRK
jgi:hypothetical protein